MKPRVRSWALILILACLGRAAGHGPAVAAPAESTYPASVRTGFAARAGFEPVPASTVPSPHELESPGASGQLFIGTYALDPDIDAYEVKGRGLGHIRAVTLARREGPEQSPFVFDLYVHGDLQAADQLAFRVRDLDIRKFLHQSVAHLEGAMRVARLQAYFAEFARKAKILYPLESTEAKAGRQTPYEAQALAGLARELRSLASGFPGRSASLESALSRLEARSEAGLPIVYQSLKKLAEESRPTTGEHDGVDSPAWTARVEDAVDRVVEISAARKVSNMVLVNNCREPGNFEVALRDALSRPLLRAAFALPPGLYDRILHEYDGLGIGEQGTGLRVSETSKAVDPSVAGRSAEAPSWRRSIPKAKIDDLEVLRASKTGRRVSAGSLRVATGFIPYSEYELEVRQKSAAMKGAYHPLSFVRVDPRVPPPPGFAAPSGQTANTYWSDPRNAGKAVPHRFMTFEDLQTYGIHLSGFEVNGVYIGRTDLEVFDPERQEGRWPFDYTYLRHLERFELRCMEDDLVEIRLIGSGARGVNFLLGNVGLGVGQRIELLLGIGTQPLIAPYNEDVSWDPLPYNVAYDRNGRILDHHAPEIGVEQVYIERLAVPDRGTANSYRIRLVSHERIVPVWEGVIEAAEPACEPEFGQF